MARVSVSYGPANEDMMNEGTHNCGREHCADTELLLCGQPVVRYGVTIAIRGIPEEPNPVTRTKIEKELLSSLKQAGIETAKRHAKVAKGEAGQPSCWAGEVCHGRGSPAAYSLKVTHYFPPEKHSDAREVVVNFRERYRGAMIALD